MAPLQVAKGPVRVFQLNLRMRSPIDRRTFGGTATQMDTQETTFLTLNPVHVYLDVGANRGQTGERLRKAGYGGRIISFEPIRECFDDLSIKAAKDAGWTAVHSAIGAEQGSVSIGVSENYHSSSILEASEELVGVLDSIRYKATEDVPLDRLDAVLPGMISAQDSLHLKIDTQGYERFVIEGAKGIMDQINSVRAEVAVSEGYKGEMLVSDAIELMADHGYFLFDAWPAWRHPKTQAVLNFDMLFKKRSLLVPGPEASLFRKSFGADLWSRLRSRRA